MGKYVFTTVLLFSTVNCKKNKNKSNYVIGN